MPLSRKNVSFDVILTYLYKKKRTPVTQSNLAGFSVVDVMQ
jgi:hypothetical protein